MPTPLKTTPNMRKHLTKAELTARQNAESEQAPKQKSASKQANIVAPAWLSDEARKIFNWQKRKLRNQGVLDPADAELLGMYADAVARYNASLYELVGPLVDPRSSTVAQAWSRLALGYAEKLGIGPNARARLAKKKAEAPPADEMADLLSGVTEFVNHGDEQ
jgi:phage terminase small subunit